MIRSGPQDVPIIAGLAYDLDVPERKLLPDPAPNEGVIFHHEYTKPPLRFRALAS